MNVPEISDHELVCLIRGHSLGAAEALYDRYAAVIYRVLCAKTGSGTQAELLLEKVLLFAWNHIDDYDPTDQRFAVWLMGITRKIA